MPVDMKKWLLLCGAIAVFVVGFWFFIFRPVRSLTMTGHRTFAGAHRCFVDTARWAEWWPQQVGGYQLKSLQYNSARISIHYADGAQLEGDLRLAPLNSDSVLIGWEGDGSIKGRQIEVVLGAFKAFVEDAKRLYGVDFYRTMSNDSTLVTISFTTTTYPRTDEIYRRIDSLSRYIAGEGAKAINMPMLNVSRTADSVYRTMVAISVDKRLKGEGRIVPKGFVPYKMLEGEVHGGVSTVEKAFEQMQRFKIDYNIQIMAMPFQSLITDRRQEPDSAKWVTKVCAPIS